MITAHSGRTPSNSMSYKIIIFTFPSSLLIPLLTSHPVSPPFRTPERLYKSLPTANSILQRHFTHPSYQLSFLRYADSQPSYPLFQYHMSTRSDTSSVYLSLIKFMWHDAPRAARKGDNPLNPGTSYCGPFCLPHTSACTKCHPNSKTSNWAQPQLLSVKLIRHDFHPSMISISCNGNQQFFSTFLRYHLIFYEPMHIQCKIELSPTPFLQTPHGCSPETST